MEFSIVGALVAGLIGTAVMSTMMNLSAKMGMTDMPPMERVTGSLMSGDPERAKQLGIMVHWVVMGTVIFGLGYAALFTALASSSWLVGLVIGVVHGLMVGVVFLPMMPAMHPRMSKQPAAPGAVEAPAGSVHLSAPGVLGSRWGTMTPAVS